MEQLSIARKMYDNKDLELFFFLKSQVETFDFPLESFMPVGRTSGTVTVTVVKFFVNFSESFVPMGRTSGIVTVNVVKFL